jgi:hypothetical protein
VIDPLHMTTSALVKMVAGGAACAEDQVAAEEELDLRVPLPELQTFVVYDVTLVERLDAGVLALTLRVLDQNNVECSMTSDGVTMRALAHAASWVSEYLRGLPRLFGPWIARTEQVRQ